MVADGFIINGGNELNGVIEVGGAKNAALPIMIATLVQEGEYNISNVPDLLDIKTLCSLLQDLGIETIKKDKNSYKIINKGIKKNKADYEIVKKMRASFLVMGPMVVNLLDSIISLPGGCSIGSRPVDIHISGFEQLGVEINQHNGYVYANSKNMKANDIFLNFPSVGATQNLMIAASKLEGTTTINNAAREPEVVDLGHLLIKMGAKIEGLGTAQVKITGGKLKAVDYSIMPDRIEAGTYTIASIVTKGRLGIKNANIEELGTFKSILEQMGVMFEKDGDTIYPIGKVEDLKPTSIITQPHPGFPTDMQPQIMLLLSLVNGYSQVEESVFENRFMHVAELNRMGAKIRISHGVANIEGVNKLEGAMVMASDLRAGAALVLAGLVATGQTTLNRIYHIDRGYESLETKLNNVGADIKREKFKI